MTDKNRQTLPDQDFERILKASAADIPPADVIRGITPHRTAVNRIITGLVLTTFTLNIAGLDYIGPAIGAILLAAGFRIIRRGNGFFKAGYALSLLNIALMAALLAVNATIYASDFNGSAVSTAYGFINLLVKMSVIICFWRGLRSAGHRFGAPGVSGASVKIDSGALLCLWYGAVSVLGLIGVTSWLIVGALIALYILLIRSFLKLSDTLEDTGYSVAAAPVHISDQLYIGVLTALFMLCVAVGYGFSSSYPMTWESAPADTATESEADSVRDHLTDAGFPDFVARDMADEDVLKLESSARVFTDSRERAVDGGKLEITTVVSMSSEDALDFSVIHYFKWADNPDHLYTEGIKIYPAYADPGFDAKGEISGRVLCEKGGETLASGYRSLGEEILTGTDFWGEYSDTVIIGTYSIPDGSKDCRGYVMYSAESPDDSPYGGYKSGFFFAHQNSLLIYPHETAEDELTSSDLSEYSCFDTDSIFATGSRDNMKMGS